MATRNLNDPNLIFAPYWYRIDATLAGLGSAVVALQFDPDADFELHYMMGQSTLDVATNFYNNFFTVAITDKGNSRIWSNANIPQKVLCGPDNGGLPLRRPVLIAAKSNISFNFTNLNAGANTVSVIFTGFKVINP